LGTSIFVSILGRWGDRVQNVISAACTIRKMRNKVLHVWCLLIVAVRDARVRATREYLERHPKGIYPSDRLVLIVLAVNALAPKIGPKDIGRRNAYQVITQGHLIWRKLTVESSFYEDWWDLFLKYSKDWIFETSK
jgi:hypothetical protein